MTKQLNGNNSKTSIEQQWPLGQQIFTDVPMQYLKETLTNSCKLYERESTSQLIL